MTRNQLLRKGRVKKRIKKINPILEGAPCRRGICEKFTIKKPKKPNSAQRKIALLFLSSKNKLSKIPAKAKRIWVYVRGEKQNIKEHSPVLFQGKGPKDLPGVNFRTIKLSRVAKLAIHKTK